VDKSAQLLVAASSAAGQLVDGIIRSVTASIEAEHSSAAKSSYSDVGNANSAPSLVQSEPASHVEPPGQDLGHQVIAGQELSHEASTESIQLASHRLPDYAGDSVLPSLVTEHSDTGTQQEEEALKTAEKLSEPLNVYEFCEDETVDICLPKPSRSSSVVAAPWTSIEPSQPSIEITAQSDNDDDDHDLMAFDDDSSPTIDRLAGTVITYSRKKRLDSDRNQAAARFSWPVSPDVKAAMKKSSKRKSASSAARLRRKRTGVAEVHEDSEEPVKKKARRKRNVDADSEAAARDQLAKPSNLPPRQATTSRRSKRSKKHKTSTPGGDLLADGDRSRKLPADDVDDDFRSPVSRTASSTAATYSKKGRRKSDHRQSQVESLGTSSGDTEAVKSPATEVEVQYTGVAQSDVVRDEPLTADTTSRRTARRKGRAQRRTATRRSSRNCADTRHREDVPADDNDMNASPGLMVDSASHDPGTVTEPPDTAASVVSDGQEQAESGPAAECLSENTEILSLNDNINDNDDDDDDDGYDDDECTRRSSPASYKSEERETCVVLAAQLHDEDSKGNSLL